MSEKAFIYIFITVGIIVAIDLLFIACCLVLSSRIDEEDKK